MFQSIRRNADEEHTLVEKQCLIWLICSIKFLATTSTFFPPRIHHFGSYNKKLLLFWVKWATSSSSLPLGFRVRVIADSKWHQLLKANRLYTYNLLRELEWYNRIELHGTTYSIQGHTKAINDMNFNCNNKKQKQYSTTIICCTVLTHHLLR